MAKIKARVQVVDEKHYLVIDLEDGAVQIPMSDDNPNHIKSAFNRLLERVRTSEISIELNEPADDLFSQVANEYIGQLNRELQEVHAEMLQWKLVLDSNTQSNPP